jgi:hypothetical protein
MKFAIFFVLCFISLQVNEAIRPSDSCMDKAKTSLCVDYHSKKLIECLNENSVLFDRVSYKVHNEIPMLFL